MAEGGIELGDYSFHDDNHFDDDEEETSFIEGSLQEEMRLSQTVDRFYQSIGEEPYDKDYSAFKLGDGGSLLHTNSEGRETMLTNKKTGEFLAKSSLPGRFGGVANMRKALKLQNIDTRSLSKETFKKFQEFQGNLPANVETISVEELPAVTENVRESLGEFNTNETVMQSNLPLREILALDKSLQSIRGELTNNLAKLGEIDNHIEREKVKLTQADDDNLDTQVKQRIESRLQDLNEERNARLEVLSENREQLRSQVSRIRETINRILHEDTTLAERIRTLFREQGITIASILTAFGFVISTIVLAITGTGSGGSTSSPSHSPNPPSGSDAKTWIKKQLHHLSELLKKLGLKAVDSLPALIGTVVSWLFSTASKVVGFMAEHLWTLLVLVTGLLIAKIKKN